MKKLIGTIIIGGSILLGGCSITGGDNFEDSVDAYNDNMADMVIAVTDYNDYDSAEESYSEAQKIYENMEPKSQEEQEVYEDVEELNEDGEDFLMYSELVLEAKDGSSIPYVRTYAMHVTGGIDQIDSEMGFEY